MSLQEVAPAAPAAVPNPVAPIDEVRAAAQRLAARRAEKQKEQAAVQESAAPAKPVVEQPQTESPPPQEASEPEPAPQEPPIGETTEGEPEPELPPIEPPGSWTITEKERFKSLPRETQEYIATRERERDVEIRRSQNEAAEKAKAIQAEQQALNQARQQYEAALPVLLQTLQSSGEFADIKTMDDVTALAANDWPRYVQWDAHQKKVQAVQSELQAAVQRQQQESQTQWQTFAAREDQLFADAFPEIADPVKGKQLQDSAINALKEVGFAPDELVKLWTTDKTIRDHRMQKLIKLASDHLEARKKLKEAVKKPVPPVQRPGTARPPGAEQEAVIKALEDKLKQTGDVKDAVALRRAKAKLTSR